MRARDFGVSTFFPDFFVRTIWERKTFARSSWPKAWGSIYTRNCYRLRAPISIIITLHSRLDDWLTRFYECYWFPQRLSLDKYFCSEYRFQGSGCPSIDSSSFAVSILQFCSISSACFHRRWCHFRSHETQGAPNGVFGIDHKLPLPCH